jgi:hypothetical protein
LLLLLLLRLLLLWLLRLLKLHARVLLPLLLFSWMVPHPCCPKLTLWSLLRLCIMLLQQVCSK